MRVSTTMFLALAATVLVATAATATHVTMTLDHTNDSGEPWSAVTDNGQRCIDRSLHGVKSQLAHSTATTDPKPPLTMPSRDNTKGYCVLAKGVGSEPSTTVSDPVLYSLVHETTRLPVAVFFRLPVGGSEPAAARDSWPSTAVSPALKPWAPSNQYYDYVESTKTATLDTTGFVTETRGHLAGNVAFAGSAKHQRATFNFANAFPSFNAGPYAFDGKVWNNREMAVQEYIKALGLTKDQLYVVVGTSQTAPLKYLRVDVPEKSAPVTRDDLIDVPKHAWTAIYDSANQAALAWKCEQRKAHDIKTNDKPACEYVSIAEITTAFGIDPMPGLSDELRNMKTPKAFIEQAATGKSKTIANALRTSVLPKFGIVYPSPPRPGKGGVQPLSPPPLPEPSPKQEKIGKELYWY